MSADSAKYRALSAKVDGQIATAKALTKSMATTEKSVKKSRTMVMLMLAIFVGVVPFVVRHTVYKEHDVNWVVAFVAGVIGGLICTALFYNNKRVCAVLAVGVFGTVASFGDTAVAASFPAPLPEE